jgi:multidrug efflux pump subunit AcrA (membrane-fusion protein)
MKNGPSRSRARLIGLYSVLGVVVLALVGLGLDSIYRTSSASATSGIEATARIGVVQSSVTTSGNIGAPVSDSLNFTSSGTLAVLYTALGDHVRAGQILASIDSTQDQLALTIAKDNLQIAKDNLATTEQGPTASQSATNTVQLETANSSLASAQETVSTDQSALVTAQAQLAADQALGCPASSTGSSSSSGSGGAGTGTGTGTGTGSSSSSGIGSSSSSTAGSQSAADAAEATAPPPASAPAVTTSGASSLLTTSATLSGTVNPDGATTTYEFEYGTSLSFGHSTAVTSAGSGNAQATVSVTVTGLKPDTGFVFRLVATNSHGTSEGVDVTFTTPQTSCVTDQQTIATDQQTVSRQQAAVQQAQGSLSSAEAQIAASSTATPATILQDDIQIMQDQQTVTEDQTTLNGATLVAPTSGTVTALSGAVGETVSAGSSSSQSPSSATGSSAASSAAAASSSSASSSSSSSSAFITITNLTDLDVVAGFAEADATKIAVGQPATVTLAALPDTEVEGDVTAVSEIPTVVSNVVTYDVTIGLVKPPATVKDGMTANVSVVTESLAGVLELPSAAITTAGTGSTVTLVQGTSHVTRAVVIGLVGSSTTQIVSGLSVGEVVIEPTVSISSTSTSTPTGGGGGGFGGGGFGGGGGGFAGGG